MTNYEKYKHIGSLTWLAFNCGVDIETGMLKGCLDLDDCKKCKFNDANEDYTLTCLNDMRVWLESEEE